MKDADHGACEVQDFLVPMCAKTTVMFHHRHALWACPTRRVLKPETRRKKAPAPKLRKRAEELGDPMQMKTSAIRYHGTCSAPNQFQDQLQRAVSWRGQHSEGVLLGGSWVVLSGAEKSLK